jgi:hypothetical protein
VKTPVREGRETTYTVANAEEGKRQVLEFLNSTKYAIKPTRTVFADVSVDAATFLSEGGANYLRNMNIRATRTSDRGFTLLVQKTSTGLISGESMTARFEDLMAAISADEISHGDKAVIIDGYILSETSMDVTLKFNVIFGNVPNDEPSAFVFPTTGTFTACDAGTVIQNALTETLGLQHIGAILMGVTTHATGYNYFYSGVGFPYIAPRMWYKPTGTVFALSDFPIYHNYAVEVCRYANSNIFYPWITTAMASVPEPVACVYFCADGVAFGTPNSWHSINEITTATYVSWY